MCPEWTLNVPDFYNVSHAKSAAVFLLRLHCDKLSRISVGLWQKATFSGAKWVQNINRQSLIAPGTELEWCEIDGTLRRVSTVTIHVCVGFRTKTSNAKLLTPELKKYFGLCWPLSTSFLRELEASWRQFNWRLLRTSNRDVKRNWIVVDSHTDSAGMIHHWCQRSWRWVAVLRGFDEYWSDLLLFFLD